MDLAAHGHEINHAGLAEVEPGVKVTWKIGPNFSFGSDEMSEHELI